MSAAWPLKTGGARMVPVLFHHAPSAQKPPKEATPVERADYRERLKQQRLNVQALGSMERLRKATPPQRHVIFCGDGS
jgi:hypothetical protein